MSTDADRPNLLCDGKNIAIRSYAAYPSMTANGEQFGMVMGFLKTLERLVRESNPTKVFVAWESGGSARRRSIYPDYKKGRKPLKLNRFYGEDLPDTEENLKYQQAILVECLSNLPVTQLFVEDCEADDVIAYMVAAKLKGEKNIIVSSDRDFYQLLDKEKNNWIYSLHKKCYLNYDNVLEEFCVTANNVALAKAICGDGSDNIKGVKGIGFKKVQSMFPMLVDDTRDILLEEVVEYATARSDSTLYKRVVESKDTLKMNLKLVSLSSSSLSHRQTMKLESHLQSYEPSLNKLEFLKILVREKARDFDADKFFNSISILKA